MTWKPPPPPPAAPVARGPARAGLRGKLLAADGPALRSAAGVPLVTAPTGATPAQLDALVTEQRRSAALVG